MNQKIKTDCEAADLKTQVNVTTIEENLQARHEIPAWRFAVMMKHADRIINQLVNPPCWVMGYDDIEFDLERTLDAVRKSRQE